MGYMLGSLKPGWTFPDKWPALPDPESNQVTAIINITQYHVDNPSQQPSIMLCEEYGGSTGDVVYDYGDGTVITYYTGESSPKYSYTKPGYYAISVTSTARLFVTVNEWTNNPGLCAIKYGSSIKIPNFASVYPKKKMQYMKFCGNDIFSTFHRWEYSGCFSLSKVECIVKPTSLPEGCFSDCYNLREIDFAEKLTAIPNNCFYYCCRLKSIDLPHVTSIGASAFFHCAQIASVNTPLLAAVGDDAFYRNVMLADFTYATGCTFGTSACGDCYNLYPNPAP